MGHWLTFVMAFLISANTSEVTGFAKSTPVISAPKVEARGVA